MIYKELEKIARDGRDLPRPYLRNVLKEYLQMYVLYVIYTSSDYNKNLIFTGGTCLKHFFGLGRLSEDIDFDFLEEFDTNDLRDHLENYFVIHQKCADTVVSLKQQGKQILLKFPVLHRLKLANKPESDFLYVKTDVSPNPSKSFSARMTSKSEYGLNFVAKHYDLPDLMAGKLHAVLTRRHLKGKDNRATIKGRDYYDLLWFIKKGVWPNIDRLSDMLGRKITAKELPHELDKKVHAFLAHYKSDFRADLVPLVKDAAFLESYIENYENEYRRFAQELFRA